MTDSAQGAKEEVPRVFPQSNVGVSEPNLDRCISYVNVTGRFWGLLVFNPYQSYEFAGELLRVTFLLEKKRHPSTSLVANYPHEFYPDARKTAPGVAAQDKSGDTECLAAGTANRFRPGAFVEFPPQPPATFARGVGPSYVCPAPWCRRSADNRSPPV